MKRGICSKCGAPRAVNSRCKPCRRAWDRQRYQDNREANLARSRAWQQANPERMRAIWRNYARRLREQLAREAAALPCLNCGMRHAPERRAKILRRMLPTTVHEIREAWPCIWGEAFDIEGAGARMIYRDLHAIGAVRVGGSWYPLAEARAAA